MSNKTIKILVDEKYECIITDKKKLNTVEDVCFVECKDANIAQLFKSEDIPRLLIDIPNLINDKENKNKI